MTDQTDPSAELTRGFKSAASWGLYVPASFLWMRALIDLAIRSTGELGREAESYEVIVAIADIVAEMSRRGARAPTQS